LIIDFLADPLTSVNLYLRDFSTDGLLGLPETEGGLVTGDLIELENPAAYTQIENGSFFNQVLLPFQSFSNNITFTLQTDDSPPRSGGIPSEVSVYLVNEDRTDLLPTKDPLRANAILSLGIDGSQTGNLRVYSPARKANGKITLKVPAPKTVTFASLSMSDPASNPNLRKASFRSTHPSLVLPASAPTIHGATVRIFNSSGLPDHADDVTYQLPTGSDSAGNPFWRAVGNPVVGYSYSDPRNLNGPVSKLTLRIPAKGTKSLTFSAKKQGFEYTLNEQSQGQVSAIVTLGAEHHHADLVPAGTRPVDRPGAFKGFKKVRRL
jgi:hypothetical protein